jgi:hypothetical protein
MTIDLQTLLTDEERLVIAKEVANRPKGRSVATAVKPILNAEPTKSRLLEQEVLPDYLAYWIEYLVTQGFDS